MFDRRAINYRAPAKDLHSKDFVGKGVACRKACKSMRAYFYRQKAMSRRTPAAHYSIPCHSARKDKSVTASVPFLAFPLGGRGTALRWMRGFYLLFCEKGKTVFRIRFPFLTLFPFPKTPHNPHKVIPYSLFQSPLFFKGQRSLVAERI